MVLVNGEIVKQNGQLTKVDWSSLAEQLQQTADAIRARYPAEYLEKVWQKYFPLVPTPVPCPGEGVTGDVKKAGSSCVIA